MKSTDLNHHHHPPPPKEGKNKKKHAYPLDPLSGLKTNKHFLSFKLRKYKIRGFHEIHSFLQKIRGFWLKNLQFSVWFSIVGGGSFWSKTTKNKV